MLTKNPFEECSRYETDDLLFTKVKVEDARELFECYSDPITKSHMNNDNCGGEWDCHSIDIVRQGIIGWNKEFDAKFYIRWSVTYKQLNKIIGTIEIAPLPNTTRFLDGTCKTGILRIDVSSSFERVATFSDILNMVSINFFKEYDIESIITKVKEDDHPRVLALKNTNFEKLIDRKIISYDDYYIKKIMFR